MNIQLSGLAVQAGLIMCHIACLKLQMLAHIHAQTLVELGSMSLALYSCKVECEKQNNPVIYPLNILPYCTQNLNA